MAEDGEVWKHIGELHRKHAELHIAMHEGHPDSKVLAQALEEHKQALEAHTKAMHEHAKALHSEVHAHGRPRGD